jgi:NitT/TauT family transport system substrate-binding protein
MHGTWRRRLITGVTAIAVMLSMATPDTRAADTKLKLGLLPLALHQLPLMMAKEKGVFAANGLDIDFVTFKGGSEVAPALLNGNIDIAQGVVAHPIKLLEKGLKTKILVLTQTTPTFVLEMASRHAAIKDVADFRGKNFKIAIARRGSDSDMMMRAVLAWKKLDPERDVTLIQIPSYANHLTAIERGEVDGGMILEPFATQAEKRGLTIPLVDFAAGQGPDELRDRPWTSLYVTESFYNERRPVATALVKATVRGHHLIGENIGEAAAVAKKYFPSFDEALLRTVIEKGRGVYQPALTPERFAAENKYLIFAGIIKTPQPYEAIVGLDMAPLWK